MRAQQVISFFVRGRRLFKILALLIITSPLLSAQQESSTAPSAPPKPKTPPKPSVMTLSQAIAKKKPTRLPFNKPLHLPPALSDWSALIDTSLITGTNRLYVLSQKVSPTAPLPLPYKKETAQLVIAGLEDNHTALYFTFAIPPLLYGQKTETGYNFKIGAKLNQISAWMRFGSHAVLTQLVQPQTGYQSRYLFFSEPAKYLTLLQKSDKLTIELFWYSGNPVYFTIPTRGLDVALKALKAAQKRRANGQQALPSATAPLTTEQAARALQNQIAQSSGAGMQSAPTGPSEGATQPPQSQAAAQNSDIPAFAQDPNIPSPAYRPPAGQTSVSPIEIPG